MPLKPGELFVASQLTTGVDAIRDLLPPARFRRCRRQVRGQRDRTPPPPAKGLVRPAIAIIEGPRASVGEITSPATPRSRRRAAAARRRSPRAIPTTSRRSSTARDALAGRVSEPRLCRRRRSRPTDGDRRIAPASTLVVHDAGRPADDRRSHPDRRQRAHRSRGHPSRAAVQAGRSRSGSQDQFESRRRLSALGLFRRMRISERGARQRQRARRARDRRGGAGDDASATAAARGCAASCARPATRRRRRRRTRAGAARLLRHRPPQPVRRATVR